MYAYLGICFRPNTPMTEMTEMTLFGAQVGRGGGTSSF